MRVLLRRNFQLLVTHLAALPEAVQHRAGELLAAEKEIVAYLHKITGRRLFAMKCRIHGDFHLGQALFTGRDFVFIDFEGDPSHSLSERRLKRSPLRDVASMIYSIHFAALTTLRHQGNSHPDDLAFLAPWLEAWYRYVSGSYLKAYLHAMQGSLLVPADRENLAIMLRCFLIHRIVLELGKALNSRLEEVDLHLQGLEMTLRECRSL